MQFVLFLLLVATSAVGAPPDVEPARDRSTDMILIDFGETGGSAWYVIDDGVMGGVSRGSFERTGDGTAVFAGKLSLANNGGFSSVRTDLGRTDFSEWVGLEVRVRGDGRTYQLRLRTDDQYDGLAYRAFFETRDGEWVTARVPFAQFVPSFRGRIVEGVPPLDRTRVRQLGFLLADKSAGPFQLEIATVRAWRTDPQEP